MDQINVYCKRQINCSLKPDSKHKGELLSPPPLDWVFPQPAKHRSGRFVLVIARNACFFEVIPSLSEAEAFALATAISRFPQLNERQINLIVERFIDQEVA